MRARLVTMLIACAATLVGRPESARAYRTLSERPEFAGTSAVVWSPPEVEYVLHSESAPGVNLAHLLEIAEPSFATWSAPDCSQLSFAYGGVTDAPAAPDDSTNTIEWLRTFWSDRGYSSDVMAATDLLYARPEGGDWQIIEADIYFNAVDYEWSARSGDPDSDLRSIRSVLTHEAGHLVGLLHSPCEPGGVDGAPSCEDVAGGEENVMYPLYVGPNHVELSADDQAGICSLYGCGAATCGPGTACYRGECREACGSDVCEANELCVADHCEPSCGGEPCPTLFCETNAECDDGSECRAGACVRPGARLGDPCTADGDCASGVCSATGFCAMECVHGLCSAGAQCVAEPDRSICEPEGGILGDMCAAPSDCVSTLCLTADPARSTCTRLCSLAIDDCPAGYHCDNVDDRVVCVPSSGGGCSVLGRRGSRCTMALAVVAVGVLLARRRRRNLR